MISLSLKYIVHKISLQSLAICHIINANSVWFIVFIFCDHCVAIVEIFNSNPSCHSKLILPLIFIPIWKCVATYPMPLSIFPFPLMNLSICIFIQSDAFILSKCICLALICIIYFWKCIYFLCKYCFEFLYFLFYCINSFGELLVFLCSVTGFFLHIYIWIYLSTFLLLRNFLCN